MQEQVFGVTFPKPRISTFTKEFIQRYLSDKHLKGSIKKNTALHPLVAQYLFTGISTHSHNLLQGKIAITVRRAFSRLGLRQSFVEHNHILFLKVLIHLIQK